MIVIFIHIFIFASILSQKIAFYLIIIKYECVRVCESILRNYI